MALKTELSFEITQELLDAIKNFPVNRCLEHCGESFEVASFDLYATCPRCGLRMKTRAFSGALEIEDVFDAVLEWLNDPTTAETVRKRQEVLRADEGN